MGVGSSELHVTSMGQWLQVLGSDEAMVLMASELGGNHKDVAGCPLAILCLGMQHAILSARWPRGAAVRGSVGGAGLGRGASEDGEGMIPGSLSDWA